MYTFLIAVKSPIFFFFMKKLIYPVSGTPCNACTRVDLVALEVMAEGFVAPNALSGREPSDSKWSGTL
jgi:hypothetical protein